MSTRIKNPTLRVILITLDQLLYIARMGITVQGIGRVIIAFLETLGGIVKLLAQTLFYLLQPPYRLRLMISQAEVAGWKSVPLIVITLGFLGMIVILELNFQLSRLLHNTSLVPGVAGLLFFREFGPTVVACMIAAKVGAGFTAEIGSMNTTDQVDALKLMGVSPVHYLAVPRFVACMVMQVALSIIGLFCCILGGYLASRPAFNFQSYIGIMNSYVGWPDFINLVLKSVALGWVVPIVSCFYGFRCVGGARGVGDSTTRAVVASILIIIVIDFTITAIADKLMVAAMSFL